MRGKCIKFGKCTCLVVLFNTIYVWIVLFQFQNLAGSTYYNSTNHHVRALGLDHVIMISERCHGCCFCCVSSLKGLTEYEEMCVLNKVSICSHMLHICTEHTSSSNNFQEQYLIITDSYGVRERARGCKTKTKILYPMKIKHNTAKTLWQSRTRRWYYTLTYDFTITIKCLSKHWFIRQYAQFLTRSWTHEQA